MNASGRDIRPAFTNTIQMMKPIAKINLGLNIVGRRPDGYHDLETVFYPIPLHDELDVEELPAGRGPWKLTITGAAVEGDPSRNLVVRAYEAVARLYELPPVHIRLHKRIPMQAGLGGGSSDAAFMVRLLNERYSLGMTAERMEAVALGLGADCPFFIRCRPCYAEGVGERMTAVPLDLSGWTLKVVSPGVAVSTREAFSRVEVRRPAVCCRDIVAGPVESWRGRLENDFERSVFALHPELAAIKQRLYDEGAVYASMSGSGSSVFGVFEGTRTDAGCIAL